MTTRSIEQTERKFTGWHMIAVMVLFFGTIITVNLIMAYHATQSWTGLVVKNSYVASQHFNEVTAQKRAQQAMGWKGTLDYSDGLITVSLRSADGSALVDALVTAKVGRPAFEQEDHVLQMVAAANGTYTATTQLAPGQWQADLTVTGPKGEIWTRGYRFIVER